MIQHTHANKHHNTKQIHVLFESGPDKFVCKPVLQVQLATGHRCLKTATGHTRPIPSTFFCSQSIFKQNVVWILSRWHLHSLLLKLLSHVGHNRQKQWRIFRFVVKPDESHCVVNNLQPPFVITGTHGNIEMHHHDLKEALQLSFVQRQKDISVSAVTPVTNQIAVEVKFSLPSKISAGRIRPQILQEHYIGPRRPIAI